MNSTSLRKVLTLILFVCLFIVLVVFCVVYIWTIKSSKAEKSHVDKSTADDEDRTTTEHSHVDHGVTTVTSQTTTFPTTTKGPVYKLKLSGNKDKSSGKVLLEYDGHTGFVCSDGFRNADARVVCRELGFKKGLTYNLMSSFPYSRYTEMQPFLYRLNCRGNEATIKECPGFRVENVSMCTWFAAVICYNDRPYELRLVKNAIHPDSGLVEMKVGGEWGIFCAIRMFDDDVADILCRSMNFTGGFAMDRGLLGETTQSRVWVPFISCTDGPEIKQSILECSLILNVENIIVDRLDHRANRYNNEYFACLSKPNSYAAAVQCLI